MEIFSHVFVVKNCNVCLKRQKYNKTEAEDGPFFKKYPFQVKFKRNKIRQNKIFNANDLDVL